METVMSGSGAGPVTQPPCAVTNNGRPVTHGFDLPRPEAHPQVFRQDPRSRWRCRTSSRFRSASYDQFLHRATARQPPMARACRRSSSRSSRSRTSTRRAVLEFVQYELEEPKYDVEECRQRGMTYAAPMKVTLRLIVLEVDEDTGTRSVRDIKEQDVYMGDMPLMTRQRHLHRQRHRARHRLARCTARRACSSTMTRARPTRRASSCSPRASSPTAVRGSTSSSTPRTSSTSASTASASCR